MLKRLKEAKTKLSIFLLTAPIALMSAEVKTTDLLGGESTRKTLSKNIQSWLWVIPTIVFVLAIAGAMIFYKKQKDKALGQGGQSEDDANTFKIMAKTAGVGLGIIILIYVILAGFGYGFLGLDGKETWNTFVVNPFRSLLGIK